MSIRVGSAHVDINAKLDTASLRRVQAQLQSQLTSLGKQFGAQLSEVSQQANRNYREIGKDSVIAWRTMLGAFVSSAPILASATNAVAGGLTMVAGSLYSTVVAASAALPVLTSLGLAAWAGNIAFKNFGNAIAATNAEDLEMYLSKLTPAARDSALAIRGLSDSANGLRGAVQEAMFKGLSDDLERLSTTLMPVATIGFEHMGRSLNGLAQSILDYVNSSSGLTVINDLFKNQASIFGTLSQAVVPFLDGFLRLLNALTPAAERLSARIVQIAENFQGWTQGEGFATRIDQAMRQAEKTAGLLFDVIGSLGTAFKNVFNAANPATNTFLEYLLQLSDRFEAFTGSVEGQKSIAKWAEDSTRVIQQLFDTIGAIFTTMNQMANPDALIMFLDTLEGAFDILGKLPLEEIVQGFLDLAKVFEPVAAPLAAMVIAGAAVQIIFGNMIAQFSTFAGAASVFKSVGGWFKSFSKGAGDAGKATSTFSGIMKGLGPILKTALKFAGLAGLAVTIVQVTAKSESLKQKLRDVGTSIKNVWDKLKGSFEQISTAAAPLMPIFEKIYSVFEKIVGIGVGLVLDTIKFAFESLGKVIEGIGPVISGLIEVFMGIFTLDWSRFTDGLKTMISGIPSLLQGLLGLFVTFFAPAKLFALAGKFFGAIIPGIRGAVPGVLSAIKGFVESMLLRFMYLGDDLMRLGGAAIRALGSGISTAFSFVVGVIRSFLSGIGTMFTTGFNFLRTIVSSVMSGIGTAFSTGFNFLRTIAANVINGISIAVQTGFTFIRTIISTIINGIVTVFRTGWNLMKSAVDAVINVLSPGINAFMVGLRDLIGAVMGAIQAVWNTIWVGLRLTASTVMGAIRTTISTVMGAIQAVWNTIWVGIRLTASSVLNAIRSVVSSVMGVVQKVISSVMGAVRGIWNTVWNAIRSTTSSVLNSIRSTVTSVMNSVRGFISSAMNTIRSTFSSVWNAIRSTVSSVTSSIRSTVSNAMSNIRSSISNAMSTVRTTFSNAWNTIKTTVSSATNDVMSTVRGIPGRIRSALGNMGGLLRSAGRDVIQGLIGGINSMLGSVGSAMSGIAGKIRNFLPFSPVKEGPLRAWNGGKPGKTLMGMLADGISDGGDRAVRAMDAVAGSLSSSFQPSLNIPSVSGSPKVFGTATAATVASTATDQPRESPTVIQVNIDPKDLEGLRTVQDFISMLNVRTAMVRGV